MAFRINAKNIALTYPQCNLTPETALTLLKALFPTALHILVSKELHQDGHPHLHASVSFPSKKNFKSSTFADLIFAGETFHGNYQASRSVTNWIAYCLKECGEDFREHGDRPTADRQAKRNADEAFAEALSAGSAQEASRIIKEKAPRDWLLYGNQIARNLEQEFHTTEEFQPTFATEEFPNIPGACLEWVSSNLVVSILGSLTRTRF